MVDKREQILAATAETIVEHGLQACPMSKISALAGCGAGTIYRYFETKQDLVEALFDDLIERLTNCCMEGYDDSLPLRERFFILWGNYYHFVLANPTQRALMDQLVASPTICAEHREQSLGTLHQVTGQLLDEGKRQGFFKDLPNELLNTVTYGSLSMIAKKQQQAPEKCSAALCRKNDILSMCWDAIRC
jgi:TetR/AcrR family transcriptional repressor of multidrug resistance operon